MKTKTLIIAVFASLLLASCITVKTHHEIQTSDFSVIVPPEWKQIKMADPDILLTREGPYRQLITIDKRPLDKPYKNSQRVLDEKMAPGQMADIIVRELNSDPKLTELQILAVAGEKISGRDGFRIVFSCIHDGFTFKTVHCGFPNGKYLYNLRFIATDESIYGKDLPAFEKLLAGFRLL